MDLTKRYKFYQAVESASSIILNSGFRKPVKCDCEGDIYGKAYNYAFGMVVWPTDWIFHLAGVVEGHQECNMKNLKKLSGNLKSHSAGIVELSLSWANL